MILNSQFTDIHFKVYSGLWFAFSVQMQIFVILFLSRIVGSKDKPLTDQQQLLKLLLLAQIVTKRNHVQTTSPRPTFLQSIKTNKHHGNKKSQMTSKHAVDVAANATVRDEIVNIEMPDHLTPGHRQLNAKEKKLQRQIEATQKTMSMLKKV